MHEPRAFFLVGPTASGKTEVGQWIAERRGYEILSADSMLVYRGLDIGTAKPGVEARRRVRYWAVDVVEPSTAFSVASFLAIARQAVAACAEGRLLVVGGSGLYVKCLTDGLRRLPPAEPAVRAKWQAVLRERGVEGLQAALRELSPAWLATLSDPQNSRRLLRALELAELGYPPPPRTWRAGGNPRPLVGLQWSRKLLAARIETRVQNMYSSGLLEETERLLRSVPDSTATVWQAIGYREAVEHLRGRCSLAEAIHQTILRTRQFAKRQMTWFRRQANVRWIMLDEPVPVPMISELVTAEWAKWGPTPLAV